MITNRSEILSYHLPRWRELPELDLYMDQIISLIDKYLSIFAPEDPDDKLMTPTMINNYVKQRMVSAPVAKKYDRPKVAFFLILAMLKRVMSISELARLKGFVLETYTPQEAYDLFCQELESAIQYVFGDSSDGRATLPAASADNRDQHGAIRAASVAFANKFYVQTILSSQEPTDGNDK